MEELIKSVVCAESIQAAAMARKAIETIQRRASK